MRRCIEKETGIEYAAKIIDISNETNEDGHMKDATLQEVQILRRVAGHPYISKFPILASSLETHKNHKLINFF